MVHNFLLAGAGALALSFSTGQILPDPGATSIDVAVTVAPATSPHAASAAFSQPDLVDTAVAAGDFSTLVAAVKAAGLVDTLKGKGPFTVLAPTDAAFAKLPRATLKSLLQPQNRAALQRILTYHVIPGRIDSTGAVQARSAKTVQGDAVTFSIEGGRLRANDAGVVANDVAASNGIIHAIDTVLMPPEPIGRLVIGFRSEAPGNALAAQLDLDRHGSLVITSVTKGSEAEQAGLRRYDVLVAVNGKPATQKRLDKAKARAGFGGTVELELIRRGRRQSVTTRVGAERAKG